jgi:hypothetical protein
MTSVDFFFLFIYLYILGFLPAYLLIYVTNGPNTNNSLYSNQLIETGTLEFIDVAVQAGVEATNQDSSGVCYGDIDNDGDQDLLVLGNIALRIMVRTLVKAESLL